jgi:hypothetical protein
VIAFEVIGSPASKGSSRAMILGGRAVNVPSGSNKNRDMQKSWAHDVTHAASVAVQATHSTSDGPTEGVPFAGQPLLVTVTFRLVRPQGHYGKKGLKDSAPTAPHVKPDLDKLVRCTLDPLEGIVFDGDARIVQLRASKQYANPGQPPGASIRVEVWRSA